MGVDAYPVVARDGATTVLWAQRSAGELVLWARQLVASTLDTPVQLTPNGFTATLDTWRLLPDGTAALLYQQFTLSPLTPYGLRFVGLLGASAQPVQTLTDDSAPNANGVAMGFDAASRATIIWTRGDYPDTDFAWLGQRPRRPLVMTSAYSGRPVQHARPRGNARVGHRLTCVSGVWVEARTLGYRWLRDGHRITGADSRRYRLTGRDRAAATISCSVIADNITGRTAYLDSTGRSVP